MDTLPSRNIALQRYYPGSHNVQILSRIELLLWDGTHPYVTKYRIKNANRVAECLNIDGSGFYRRKYTKGDDDTTSTHTKFELNVEIEEITREQYDSDRKQAVEALVAPLYGWRDEALQRNLRLFVKLYGGKNIWLVLLWIQMLLEPNDQVWTFIPTPDFRMTLPDNTPSLVWQTLLWTSAIGDGSQFHDNKLAKFPLAPEDSTTRSRVSALIEKHRLR